MASYQVKSLLEPPSLPPYRRATNAKWTFIKFQMLRAAFAWLSIMIYS